MRHSLPLLLTLLLAIPARAEVAVFETAHYRVEVEPGAGDAEEMGKVLEAAWVEFGEFFGAHPDLDEGERLRVFVGATRATFAARMRADGVPPPKAGGYYSPGTKTAYLYRQPTIYNSRCLLLHETTHQFHYRARTGDRSLPQKWYVEGLAEYLSRHYWDGETLVLGVVPTITLEDYPAQALDAVEKGEPDLEAAVAGESFHRPLFWALNHWIFTEGGERKAKRLRDKLDRGSGQKTLLFRNLGSPKKLTAALAEWLPEHQEPWRQLFNEWEGIGPGQFLGRAQPPRVSACAAKGDTTYLAATLETPAEGSWKGGLLLHYEDRDNYTTAVVSGAGEIRVARRQAGAWKTLAVKRVPPPDENGHLRFEARRKGGEVHLLIQGEEIGSFELPGATLGLAVQSCTLRFRDVTRN